MSATSSGALSADDIALVSGGAGFIGSHLLARLGAEGMTLHATSRRPQTRVHGVTWWETDLSDLAQARRLFSTLRPGIVYHLAGSVGAAPDMSLVLPTYHSLLTSTVNVLMMAAEFGCRRVILAGSFTEPVPGHTVPTPGSPYAAAKWADNAYGRMFHALYQSPVVNLRPFMTYGPGQNPDKVIPSVARKLLGGEAPRLSSGRVRADWVYIGDVVDAFVTAARQPGIDGASIDLGTGTLVSLRTVIEEIVTAVGTDIAPIFGAVPDRPAENEIAADTGPAAELIGWRARTSLADGVRETVEWQRAAAMRS